MTLEPFLTASPYLQVHMVSAILGLTLGPVILYRRRRDRVHKILGYIWVVAMATLALSSFWIEAFWSPVYFGPLHGFAVLTLASLWMGVRHAKNRNFDAHQAVFRSLYSNGLIIAGAFTFLPGRSINHMIFGDRPEMGWAVIAIVLTIVMVRILGPRFGVWQRSSP